MERKLRYSPLVEALIEFRFSPETAWDWTVPGRLFERIRSRYPTAVEPAKPAKVPISPGQFEVEFKPLGPEQLRFESASGTRIVQVGSRLLTLNVLDYRDWNDFKPEILWVLAAHAEIVRDAEFTRIGMRYINSVKVSEPFDPERYLTFAPLRRGTLNRPVRELRQSLRLQVLAEGDQYFGDIHLQAHTRTIEGQRRLIVDIDLGCIAPAPLPTSDGVSDWLDQAHGHIQPTFKDAFTDACHHAFENGGDL